jgi:hypothetical protein
MAALDVNNLEAVAARLSEQAERDAIRVSLHAHQEMVEEDITYSHLREVLFEPCILENYPEHKRGPCCLVCRQTAEGRHLHVVCTTSLEVIVVIATYEPKPPRWATPFKRGGRK